MAVATKNVELVGYASGVAAADSGCSAGPEVLKASPFFAELADRGLHVHWNEIIKATSTENQSVLNVVAGECTELAHSVATILTNNDFFTVLGGDHSSAIGTWSGAYSVMQEKGDMGLIWIDAHMDSHTPETSETGNIHGMPFACLLGFGHSQLTSILTNKPKVKPHQVCLIGARSFEAGEEALLKKLNVRIYFMDEVKERGLQVILSEAIAIANTNTAGFGITIDVDSIDPIDAPGTGVSEAGGLSGSELCQALTQLCNEPRLIGAEIVEFDPHLDKDGKTEKLVAQLLSALTIGYF